MGAVVIKAGHVQPVWAGHPWVFAQAIDRIEGGVAPGDEILVRDARGITLGLARRAALGLPSAATSAVRLVHAEGDDLPGLVVDQLGDVIAVQLGTIGLKSREGVILDLIMRLLKPRAIIDRTPLTHAK